MDVGARICQLRKAYHVSQYALWKRSGVAQAALSQYESGRKVPSVDTLEKICRGLGISLADFFAENIQNVPFCITEDERRLLEIYRTFPPAHQDTIQDTLHFLAGRQEEMNRRTSRSFQETQGEPDGK